MGRSVEYIETVIREPVVTRPLFMQQRNLGSDPSNYFFTHDGNKNVSDVVSYQRARGVVAHYDYAPFGAVTSAIGPREWVVYSWKILNYKELPSAGTLYWYNKGFEIE